MNQQHDADFQPRRLLLSLREFAEITAQSPSYVKKLADQGALPVPTVQIKPRGRRFVRVADAEEWVASLPTTPAGGG